VSAGRFKAIDRLRRRATFDTTLAPVLQRLDVSVEQPDVDDHHVEDDRLRLIFTCCHPALAHDAQIALTLREVCGLTTEEIARAYLIPPPTIAQRIVRAKAKIRDAKIAYQVPTRMDLPERLHSVLHVIYFVFNEGYSASSGSAVVRHDLANEAITLGRVLVELLPEPEAESLLALMLLHDSRRAARMTADGELVLLDDQDRSLWNRTQILEGCRLVEKALKVGPVGPYQLQAAIAAVHGEALTVGETDWPQIVGLYDLLMMVEPTPVVKLNRAVAVAMRDGAAKGLEIIEGIVKRGELSEYHLAHAARADLLRRLGRTNDAIEAYERALNLNTQEPERRFLSRRIAELRQS
jgi:RNA polymerase sigma-70 factor (ECF subfamily)